MSRTALDATIRALEASYQRDPFSSLRANLKDIHPHEWLARPANHKPEVFGDDPELSIAQIVLHVGGAKRMYANYAFGDATMVWGTNGPPSMEMEAVLAWLEEGHVAFIAAVDALGSDDELAARRRAPNGRMVPTEALTSILTNHDTYHSGEINRQRSLLRGATGWDLAPDN